ncbi:MAG TPA: macro domain-containing protein [Thermoanaerobaculia bacterium]|jgi:O-acetyl-ADP-ribose deacetylase (regulator of RNase III)
MHIQLLRADVNSLKVDAIIAPADPQVPMPPDSRAVVTTGGNLLARFVIHIAIPPASAPDADAKLRDSTRAALERGEDLAVASIGLPAVATGPFGFTTERCARAMLAAAVEHRTRARSLQRAVFCLFGIEEYQVFERILGELQA